jgi:hypothetical protein
MVCYLVFAYAKREYRTIKTLKNYEDEEDRSGIGSSGVRKKASCARRERRGKRDSAGGVDHQSITMRYS